MWNCGYVWQPYKFEWEKKRKQKKTEKSILEGNCKYPPLILFYAFYCSVWLL